MTYRDYINRSDFADVWPHLHHIYNETDDIKATYHRLYESVKALPCAATSEQIILKRDRMGDVSATGTLDTQENLVDREVVIMDGIKDTPAEVAAHLLYWCTMYGFKTAAQFDEDFSKWITEQDEGPFYTGKSILKYIFLDFDGVLNTEQYQATLAISKKPTKDMYGPVFDPATIARLKRLYDETKAAIIIISSWRFVHDIDTLDEMWIDRGLPKRMSTVLAPWADGNRLVTLDQFDFGKYVPYVIIDDEDTYSEKHRPYLIKPNPVIGLSDKDVDRAIEILNRFDNYSVNDFHPNKAEEMKARQRQGEIEAPSLDRKRLRFWRDTILADSAISWSWNLKILSKKLEYNIGYWKYVHRHESWQQDANRMELCRNLLRIASEDYTDMTDIYVNVINASRYGVNIGDDDDTREYQLKELRKKKAYSILWRFLDHNMRDWWD